MTPLYSPIFSNDEATDVGNWIEKLQVMDTWQYLDHYLGVSKNNDTP